jgi:CRP-like cAMP-binding protein
MSSDLTQPELPAIGFVAEFSEIDRQILSGYGEFLPVHDGKSLINEGEEQNSLYLVISGRMHVTNEVDGRRVLLGRLGQGDLVGEVNIFDPHQASATVTAMEFSQVWRVDRAMIESFIQDNPGAAAQLLVHISTQLSKRLRETNEKVAFVRRTLTGGGAVYG